MKILLTGGTGFIGSNLLLSNSNDFFYVLVRKKNRDRIKRKNIKYINLDLSENVDVIKKTIPRNIDIIIHLAQYNDNKSENIFEGNLNINFQSTLNLLKVAKLYKIRKFIFASTGNVYEPLFNNKKLLEKNNLNPISYYGRSKYISEQLINYYSSEVDFIILRLFFPYGPGQSNRLIPNLITKIISKSPVMLNNNSGHVITPTYINDVIKTLNYFINNDIKNNVYNVASNNSITLKKLCLMIGEVVNISPKFVYSSESKLIIKPSIKKIDKLIEVKNFISISKGLKKTISAMK